MKYSEMIKMSSGELNVVLRDVRNHLLDLKLMHSVSSIENPMLIKSKRRIIARIETALSQLKNKLVSDVN